MKVVDLNFDGLNFIHKEAVAKAVRENRDLNLSYTIVEENMLIEVDGAGNRKVLRESKFATVKSTYGTRVLTLKK